MDWKKLVDFLKGDGLTVLIVVVIVAAYAFLRTSGDSFESLQALEAELSDGTPTVVSFYSNTCSICLASKPRVDQLERDLEGQARLLRLNVREEVGMQLAARWGVRGVPTFFVVDADGEIVYARAGAPEVEQIKSQVAALVLTP